MSNDTLIFWLLIVPMGITVWAVTILMVRTCIQPVLDWWKMRDARISTQRAIETIRKAGQR